MNSSFAARWSLAGKNAVVTGGSKGIGLACARELISFGATVLICARTPAAVEKAVASLNGDGGVSFGCASRLRTCHNFPRHKC